VLLFHELGHYVGMRFFGYRNVRMFFIPLFGAAVSGQNTSAKGYQEAIVTLLGPLPGIGLALLLSITSITPGVDNTLRPKLLFVSLFLVILNGFNLLPVFPLDGGRFLNQVLFSRNRYLEAGFQLLAALALMAYGFTHKAQLIGFVGLGLLLTLRASFASNSLARQLRAQLGEQLPPRDAPLPLGIFCPLVAEVERRVPGRKSVKTVARLVFNVWERMHIQPPGVAATLGLLLLYLGGIFLAGVMAVGIAVLPKAIEHQISQRAQELNRQLPKQIDESLRCERVEVGPGRRFSYVYTVTKPLTNQQKQSMQEAAKRRALTDQAMRTMLAMNVTIRYVFYDTSGRTLFEYTVER